MAEMNDRLEILDWDTEFFDRRIGQITGGTLTDEEGARAIEWATENGVECLYFVADTDHPNTHRVAQNLGFDLVGTRVTFRANVGHSAPTNFPGIVRNAVEADRETLEEIARVSFTSSRFFFDTRFPESKAAELYATWIRKILDGRLPGRVFVAEAEDRPVGFVTCSIEDADDRLTGKIGLLAVAPDARGHGVGSALMSMVGELYRHAGAHRAEVVTQARNESAQRLYQRHGYVVDRTQHWFHWWAS